MSTATIPGISANIVTTDRLTTRVLSYGPEDGIPVLFIHGNFSSASWWEETMVSLPDKFRGIAPDLRGFGDADPGAKVNATNGMGDFADDAITLMSALGYERFHIVGSSLGGLVAWWLMAYQSQHLFTVTLAAPSSPYGFGATKDELGTATTTDFSGSGGGLLNLELIEAIKRGDQSTDLPSSPRSVLRRLVWGPEFIPDREDELLDAMLRVHIGEQGIPGDKQPSVNWPYVAPGQWGPMNALSPKYMGTLIERILAAETKADVLWIYGTEDIAIANSAASDPGTWGPTGLLPGFPGADTYPPQPMMDQISTVLKDYLRSGGEYREVTIEGSAHVPYITHLDAFNHAFHTHIEHYHSENDHV